ncbi:hypothetical protein [Aquirhabdus sp.]|uniref:hypothetical protein n=1 Tax=Aquirhabdus sp. TaxID=2824160 RepID=UPI00396CEE29
MKINLIKNKHCRSFFLLPIDAHKVLQDCGWLFEAEQRISPNVVTFLEQALSLQKQESHRNLDVYRSDDIKMNVFYDDNHLIEEIYIRLHGVRNYVFLRDILLSAELKLAYGATVFDPNHTLNSKYLL